MVHINYDKHFFCFWHSIVYCRLGLHHFHECYAYEYSQMNKSMNDSPVNQRFDLKQIATVMKPSFLPSFGLPYKHFKSPN